MCGKFVEDWDGQISMVRMYYLKSIASRDYDQSVHFLTMMHSTLPPNARISDFLPFEELKNNGMSFTNTTRKQMASWCNHWGPLVESAIAVHRDKSLRELNV